MSREFRFSVLGVELISLKVGDRTTPKLDQIIKPKPKSITEVGIPQGLEDYYGSVEGAIYSALSINSNDQVGDLPFNQGGMGGDDNALNSLNVLNQRLSDQQIASYFLKNRASKEFMNDPGALAKVLSAIGSIRGTQLLHKDEDAS